MKKFQHMKRPQRTDSDIGDVAVEENDVSVENVRNRFGMLKSGLSGFARGMACALDIGGTFQRGIYSHRTTTVKQTDFDALNSDWLAVVMDLHVAVKHFEVRIGGIEETNHVRMQKTITEKVVRQIELDNGLICEIRELDGKEYTEKK